MRNQTPSKKFFNFLKIQIEKANTLNFLIFLLVEDFKVLVFSVYILLLFFVFLFCSSCFSCPLVLLRDPVTYLGNKNQYTTTNHITTFKQLQHYPTKLRHLQLPAQFLQPCSQFCDVLSTPTNTSSSNANKNS